MMKFFKRLLLISVFLTGCGPGVLSKNTYTFCSGTNCCTGTNCGYFGLFNQAYSFNGTSSYYALTGTSQPLTSQLTVEMFFKTSTLVVQTLFNYGTFSVQFTAAGTMTITTPTGAACITPTTSSVTGVFADGQLHHMAANYTTALATLYIDGAIAVTVANGNWSGCSISSLYIGSTSAPSSYFTGIIDEVRVSSINRYSTAFTVPYVPFPNDGNTLDLFHFDNNVSFDSYSNGGAISANALNFVPSPHP